MIFLAQKFNKNRVPENRSGAKRREILGRGGAAEQAEPFANSKRQASKGERRRALAQRRGFACASILIKNNSKKRKSQFSLFHKKRRNRAEKIFKSHKKGKSVVLPFSSVLIVKNRA